MAHIEAIAAAIARLEKKPPQTSEPERTLKKEYKKITKTVHNKDYLRPCPGAELCTNLLCPHTSSASYGTASYATSNHDPPKEFVDDQMRKMNLVIEGCVKKHNLVISDGYAMTELSRHEGKIAQAVKAIAEDIKNREKKLHETGRVNYAAESATLVETLKHSPDCPQDLCDGCSAFHTTSKIHTHDEILRSLESEDEKLLHLTSLMLENKPENSSDFWKSIEESDRYDTKKEREDAMEFFRVEARFRHARSIHWKDCHKQGFGGHELETLMEVWEDKNKHISRVGGDDDGVMTGFRDKLRQATAGAASELQGEEQDQNNGAEVQDGHLDEYSLTRLLDEERAQWEKLGHLPTTTEPGPEDNSEAKKRRVQVKVDNHCNHQDIALEKFEIPSSVVDLIASGKAKKSAFWHATVEDATEEEDIVPEPDAESNYKEDMAAITKAKVKNAVNRKARKVSFATECQGKILDQDEGHVRKVDPDARLKARMETKTRMNDPIKALSVYFDAEDKKLHHLRRMFEKADPTKISQNTGYGTESECEYCGTNCQHVFDNCPTYTLKQAEGALSEFSRATNSDIIALLRGDLTAAPRLSTILMSHGTQTLECKILSLFYPSFKILSAIRYTQLHKTLTVAKYVDYTLIQSAIIQSLLNEDYPPYMSLPPLLEQTALETMADVLINHRKLIHSCFLTQGGLHNIMMQLNGHTFSSSLTQYAWAYDPQTEPELSKMWKSTLTLSEALDKIIDQVLINSANEEFQKIRDAHMKDMALRTSALQEGLGEFVCKINPPLRTNPALPIPNVPLPLDPRVQAELRRILADPDFPNMAENQIKGLASIKVQLQAKETGAEKKNKVARNQKAVGKRK